MKDKKLTFKDWLRSSEDHLRNVQEILYYFQETPEYPIAGFHCHQTAEKSLKGFLVFNNVEPPDLHNLIEIYELALLYEPGLSVYKKDVELLYKYYFETQFPQGDEPAAYSLDEIESAHDAARRIFHYINKVISEKEFLNSPGKG